MIISFSIPRMLPLIWNGLVQLDVPQTRDRELSQFVTNIRAETQQFCYERVKRQTIRPLSLHWQRLIDNPGKYKLDLFWKAQYSPERQRLGTIPCQSAQIVTIVNHPTGLRILSTILLDQSSPMWQLDGFDSENDMRRYFVPEANQAFHGVLIRW